MQIPTRRSLLLAASSLVSASLALSAHAQDLFEYDDLGRLVRVDFSDGHVIEYSYDPAGNRSQVVIENNAAATADSANVPEDSNVEIDVLDNDAGFVLESKSITNVTTRSDGSAQIIDVNGVDWIRYTPDPDFDGSDSFSYTVTDGYSTDTASVSITVIADNDPPVAVNDSISVDEDDYVVADLRTNDSDPESQPLTIVSASGASNGVASVEPGGVAVRYTPNANYFGSDSFSYVVSDGVLTDNATVTVTVASVNDAPVANDDSLSVTEDVAQAIDPRSNDTDIDGGALTITAKTNGSKGSVSITGGGTGLLYTPNANANGSDAFTYTISDGAGGTDTATVSVSIAAVEDPPTAVNDSVSTNEDVIKTFDPRTNDIEPDGQTLTITGKTNGTKGSVAIVNGGANLRYTPNLNANGADSFSYTISDGTSSSSATVSMTINAVNDAPNAVNDSYTNVNKNVWTTLNVLANDTDVENNTLTITYAYADVGTLEIINGGTALRFRHLGSNPSSVLNYAISDGNGGTDGADIFMSYSGGGMPEF